MKGMLAATALVAALVLAGCAAESEGADEHAEESPRFEFERLADDYIITDTETGVQYLYVKIGYAGGMTVLVDADGKPLVKEDVE